MAQLFQLLLSGWYHLAPGAFQVSRNDTGIVSPTGGFLPPAGLYSVSYRRRSTDKWSPKQPDLAVDLPGTFQLVPD